MYNEEHDGGDCKSVNQYTQLILEQAQKTFQVYGWQKCKDMLFAQLDNIPKNANALDILGSNSVEMLGIMITILAVGVDGRFERTFEVCEEILRRGYNVDWVVATFVLLDDILPGSSAKIAEKLLDDGSAPMVVYVLCYYRFYDVVTVKRLIQLYASIRTHSVPNLSDSKNFESIMEYNMVMGLITTQLGSFEIKMG